MNNLLQQIVDDPKATVFFDDGTGTKVGVPFRSLMAAHIFAGIKEMPINENVKVGIATLGKLIGTGGANVDLSSIFARLDKMEKLIKSHDEDIEGINESLDEIESGKTTKKITKTAITTENRPKPPV